MSKGILDSKGPWFTPDFIIEASSRRHSYLLAMIAEIRTSQTTHSHATAQLDLVYMAIRHLPCVGHSTQVNDVRNVKASASLNCAADRVGAFAPMHWACYLAVYGYQLRRLLHKQTANTTTTTSHSVAVLARKLCYCRVKAVSVFIFHGRLGKGGIIRREIRKDLQSKFHFTGEFNVQAAYKTFSRIWEIEIEILNSPWKPNLVAILATILFSGYINRRTVTFVLISDQLLAYRFCLLRWCIHVCSLRGRS